MSINRVIKLLDRRRKKGLLFLTAAAVMAALSETDTYFLRDIAGLASIACDLAALYYIFITPGAGKRAAKKLETALLRLTRGILRLVKRVMDKLSFSNGRAYRGARMADGYRDTSEKISAVRIKPGRKKRRKYKNMDNIEKVRFLYEKKVILSVRHGAQLYECMTPNETGRVMIDGGYMKKSGSILIDTYNEARYDSDAVISDEAVENAKKSI